MSELSTSKYRCPGLWLVLGDIGRLDSFQGGRTLWKAACTTTGSQRCFEDGQVNTSTVFSRIRAGQPLDCRLSGPSCHRTGTP